MYYWRDEYFKALSEMSKLLADYPEWNEYNCYCKLLEQGLRKKAQAHLTNFISKLSSQTFSERKRFVSWIYQQCFDSVAVGLFMPHSLLKKLIEPTLLEWTEIEPENSEPHRWLGTTDHLRKAIALNPDDEMACVRLIVITLNRAGYSVHELPSGYLGDPEEDLAALDEIEAVAPKVRDEKRRAEYLSAIRELRREIRNYLSTRNAT